MTGRGAGNPGPRCVARGATRYNITNKKCQNVFPMPWTMTVVSLFVGIPWVLMLWATGIRKAPKLDMAGWKVLLPIGAGLINRLPCLRDAVCTTAGRHARDDNGGGCGAFRYR